MEIEDVLKEIYSHEINVSITSFWDNGYEIKIGDFMNTFSHVGECDRADEIAGELKRLFDLKLKTPA